LGISWGNSGYDLVVIDRRDIHNLVRVGVLQIPDFVAWRGHVSGRYLYLATPTKAEIAIVDLVNPAAPAVVARVPLGAASAHVTVAGDLAFVAATAAGLATTSLGATATLTGSATTGGNAMDVAIAAGHAYIANELGIAVLPVSVPPLIDPSKIAMSLDGASGNVTVTGGYRAVAGTGTVSATITNTVTNATTTVTVAANGSFSATLAASGGHALTLSATDALNRTAGPVAIGTVPFGSTATFLPIYNTGDANYRVRTLKAEGKWLVAASDDAYGIHSSRIVVYDISNPAVPVPARSLDNPTNIVRDIELVGGRLYTVGDRLSSIDLNDPAPTWSSSASDRSGTETAIAVAGGYAFTAEEWNTDGRVHVYDMSIPTAPKYLATHVTAGVGGNNYDDLLAYGDNYLVGISDDGGGRDVVVIDRRDVNALVRVGHLSISQIAAYRGAISGNTLYLAGNDGGVAMVDLTNPTSPQLLSVSNTAGYAVGVDAAGDAVFAADRGAGVVFLKKDGAALTQLGVQAVGGDAWDVVHEGSTLYVAMEQGIVVIDGLFTVPRIDTDFITLTSTGAVTGTAYAVSGAPPLSVEVRNVTTAAAMTVTAGANGSFAAALPASPGDAFTVKVTDTFGRVAGPLAIGTIPFGSSTTLIPMQGTGDGNFRARTVVAEGKWAAVGSFPAYGTSSNRIVVYDISNPAAPLQSRVLHNPRGSVRDLKIIDGWLYATADRTAWLDLNDPASNWVMAPDRSGSELAVAVAGGYLYTAEEWNTDGRIHIFDFSNRAAPRYLRTTGGLAGVGGNNFTSLIPYGTDYLIAVGDGGGNRDVVVIDRRDVNNLVRVAHLSIASFDAFRARIAGSRLFIAGIGGGVAMVDLANPASPQLLSVYDTAGGTYGVDASGSAVMATDRAFGVVFLDATTGVLTKTGTHFIGGDAWDCALAGRVLYVANEQGLVVIDNVFAPPRIEANFISVDSTGTVTGRAGAITGQAPLTVTLKNVATAATIEVTAHGDGSFSALVPASAGETLTVAVTDAYGRKAGPVVIGTIPFGTATKVFPITTTDANFRARTIKLEGARAVVGSFPDYGLSSAQMVVLDLTNPSLPAVSRTVADPGGATRAFELVNGWLY
ncbi:MAG TPA: hypothetical protein VEU30_01125, partial [Thermoanaerobaculia bacterium]|nr:hypothetical protein [Thermoanaerobaculia bacterium]